MIPYFIAAHPGTTDEDMLELALWLKRNGYRADQVQAFLPSPLASATTMYHTGKNPLRKVHREGGDVTTAKGPRQRKLHKAFLRWHDADNWPMLRQALARMGRSDLIGRGSQQLVPAQQPAGWVEKPAVKGGNARAPIAHAKHRPRRGLALTQHTGLPPRRANENIGWTELSEGLSPQRREAHSRNTGGDGGIRTLDTAFDRITV